MPRLPPAFVFGGPRFAIRARALVSTLPSARRRLAPFPLVCLLLAACSGPPAPPRVENLPMYGAPAIPRPTLLRQADAHFVETAAAEFAGDRKLACISWIGQGDRLLADGNLDGAMRRYNEAWLLDPANYEVYEGFARVLLAQEKTSDALPHLRKAIELCPDPAERAALIAELNRLTPPAQP